MANKSTMTMFTCANILGIEASDCVFKVSKADGIEEQSLHPFWLVESQFLYLFCVLGLSLGLAAIPKATLHQDIQNLK